MMSPLESIFESLNGYNDLDVIIHILDINSKQLLSSCCRHDGAPQLNPTAPTHTTLQYDGSLNIVHLNALSTLLSSDFNRRF